MAYFDNQPGGFQGQVPFGQQPNAYFYNGPVQGQGYQYVPPQQPMKVQNVLTPDEIAHLVKDKNRFSLALNEEEKLRSFCTHRWNDRNEDALVEDVNDGRVMCQICGYKFKPLDAYQTNSETLQAAVDDILDVLQTIKLIWIDIDNTVAREYFQIIPLIERIPKLFDIAAKNYAKHDSVMPWSLNSKNMSTVQAFAMLNSMLNAGAPNPAMYQQAQAMYQQPQPGFQTAYGVNPAMGMQPGMSNGFGTYGAPMGYTPQQQGFQTVYGATPQQQGAPQPAPQQAVNFDTTYQAQGAPQPAPAPVNTQQGAPEAAAATTDGNTKTVTAQFKA